MGLQDDRGVSASGTLKWPGLMVDSAIDAACAVGDRQALELRSINLVDHHRTRQ